MTTKILDKQDNSVQMTEEEKERLAQPYTLDPEIAAQLQAKVRDIHSFCREHDIPVVLATCTAKQNAAEQEDTWEYRMQLAVGFPGERTPPEFAKVVDFLENPDTDLDQLAELVALMKHMA